MNKGIVKWFNAQKGYGFISDESGNDVFVHYSNIIMGVDGAFKKLIDGQKVSYDLGRNEKGNIAINVIAVNE